MNSAEHHFPKATDEFGAGASVAVADENAGGKGTFRSGIRILLVEDHAETRRSLASLLEAQGWVVVAVETIFDAKRAAIEQDHFNLVITDIGLPDGSGLDLLTWLRKRTAALPAIALTAFSSEHDVAATQAAGFAAHLVKPATFDQVRSAVLRHASQSQH